MLSSSSISVLKSQRMTCEDPVFAQMTATGKKSAGLSYLFFCKSHGDDYTLLRKFYSYRASGKHWI